MVAELINFIKERKSENLGESRDLRWLYSEYDFAIFRIYLYVLCIVYIHDRDISEKARELNCVALQLVYEAAEKLCEFFTARAFQFAWDSDYYQEDALEEISDFIREPEGRVTITETEFFQIHEHMLYTRSDDIAQILREADTELPRELKSQFEKTVEKLLLLKEEILTLRKTVFE